MGHHSVWRLRVVVLLSLVLGVAGCEDDEAEDESSDTSAAAATGPLLDQAGELVTADASDARGRYDRYFVDVSQGDRLIITLHSEAFDPVLEVTPPGQGPLVNDDFEGDLTRSRIELVAPSAGAMKVEVRAYDGQSSGAYQVRVARASDEIDAAPTVPVLSVGDTLSGEVSASDHVLSDGDRFDSYVLHADGPVRIAVRSESDPSPRTSLVGPDGLALTEHDHEYDAPTAGTYRLQVIGRVGTRYRVSVERGQRDVPPIFARAHHQFNRLLERLTGGGRRPPPPGTPPSPPTPDDGTPSSDADDPSITPATALPIQLGDRHRGSLEPSDPRLQSGEHFDLYSLEVAQPGGEIAIDLESSAFDCFLRVEGPSGRHWENDDHAGSLNSRVRLSLEETGTYRIVATSYRPGQTGEYELKVLSPRDAASGDGGSPSQVAAGGPERAIEGELAAGDTQLRSGEFVDEHRFEWPAGARVHLEARSTDFDTYLIVHPPNGPQRDNDDMTPGQTLNAGMDLQISEAGAWRVLVTSYRPGETGRYTLAVRGGTEGSSPAPAPAEPPSPSPSLPPPSPSPSAGARVETGELSQGDAQLSSGEFNDTYEMSFTPRSAVSIRLNSTAFDTYLIVRSPSGHQEDNDDLVSGNLNSGLDIPVAEPGTYRLVVTSYRPGETGAYTLTVTEGASVVEPPPAPTGGGGAEQPPGATGGGRVWGLFAGITDYPGTTNDLPECANDARKLAEAVRNQGNMPSDQEFLFTDGQATVANIRQTMQTISQRIRPDDVFVFFYSGHGGQTQSSSDPDELDQRDEYLMVHDGRLMDDELGQLFDQIQARVALIALDACFAGGFAKDVITRRGRVGMFSSEEDVTSAVAGRFQAGGYLSHFLRLGIAGEADNDPHNDILTVGELTHYTWRQFGQHASDVRMSMGYQHLVVDRGAVHTNEVLWAVRR